MNGLIATPSPTDYARMSWRQKQLWAERQKRQRVIERRPAIVSRTSVRPVKVTKLEGFTLVSNGLTTARICNSVAWRFLEDLKAK
jgi:hypothetical protein